MRVLAGPVASATFKTSVVFGLRLVLQTITLIAVARVLGPSEFGAFSAISALAFALGTVSSFGTHLLVLSAVSRDPESFSREANIATPVTLVCGGALLLIYLSIGICWVDARALGFISILAVGLTEIVAQPLLQITSAQMQGEGLIARSQLLIAAPLFCRAIIAGGMAMYPVPEPLTLYTMISFGGTFFVLLGAVFFKARWIARLGDWRFPTSVQFRTIKGLALVNAAAIAPAEVDKVLVFKLLSNEGAGVYAAASRIVGATVTPVLALMISAAPKLFRQAALDQDDSRYFLRSVIGAAAAYGVILAIALNIAAAGFAWIFGDRYSGLDEAIRLLALAALPLCLRIAVGNILMTLGLSYLRVASELTGISVMVLAAIILTPMFGISGMIFAVVLSELFISVSGLVFLVWRVRGI